MNIKLFKQKNFTLLIVGKFISLLGSNILQFALSLYVLSITGSATIFASMLSILILPRLLLSPIAGVFGDWFDRKRIIILLDLANTIIIFIYSVIFITNGSISIPLLYLFVILLEITELFFHSSMSAILPSIVTSDELMNANSTNSLILSIGQLLAPILASIIYAAFGMDVILIVSSIGFLISAIIKIFLTIPKTHKLPEKINIKTFRDDLMGGINIIKENKVISSTIAIGTIINFCISPLFSIGLIFIIKEVLKSTDFQFGLFQSILALSMIVAPMLCSGVIKKITLGKLCFTSFLAVGCVVIIMSVIPSPFLLNLFNTTMIPYVLLIILSFIIGILVTIVNISMGTLFDQIVPLEYMGRTSTVFNLAVTVFIPIGQMIFGSLYDILLASYVILLSGILMMIGLFKYKSVLLKIDEPQENLINDDDQAMPINISNRSIDPVIDNDNNNDIVNKVDDIVQDIVNNSLFENETNILETNS